MRVASLRFDIWSDIACPWCYIGKRRLERTLSQLSDRDDVQLTWHAFELNPAAPPLDGEGNYAERLAKKYGTSTIEARAMIDRVKQVAMAEGLAFDFDIIRPGNTFDAHRVLCMAREHGLQNAVKERFMQGYFCEGQVMSDPDTLVQLAVKAGLDGPLVRNVLANSGSFASDVRQDEAQARDLGIHGVPFFVLNGHYGVSGAQLPEVLLQVIEQARLASGSVQNLPEGAQCGPDGC
jgi:predicted DsbA family dithiol-disulfide isomerase